ncbi:MAG: lipopolysaccharide transport periplasmic protein LptA [Gammaproteobacteria bacterium]|uniref:lipopolysaccharide transport periplasmic protein LptA n=1 Tax=unclassified Pseudacidovorax TaxID=2620592 RepID=UPI001B6396E3|nr:lipopolysaccharide transport periplasmic protein LptA [Pseudacidovorax sp.]MBP6894174.1 lipopolysaccharide transport periplasmic protein LptA [Pseudacidovorax sp.]
MTHPSHSTISLPWRRLGRAMVLVAALGLAAAAQAEKADRNQPMNIEADSLRYDDLKQTSIFTGRVVVTKGTLLIRGTRVEVRQDPEGYQYGVVTADPGQRGYFKQRRDGGNDEWIEGEGEVIEYDGRADTVKFIRRAVMRRLTGTTVTDETSGPLITYNQTNDTFTVNGAPPPPGGTQQPGGRVRAILSPRSTEPTQVPAPGPRTGAPLRQSGSLSGQNGGSR